MYFGREETDKIAKNKVGPMPWDTLYNNTTLFLIIYVQSKTFSENIPSIFILKFNIYSLPTHILILRVKSSNPQKKSDLPGRSQDWLSNVYIFPDNTVKLSTGILLSSSGPFYHRHYMMCFALLTLTFISQFFHIYWSYICGKWCGTNSLVSNIVQVDALERDSSGRRVARLLGV